MTGPTLDTQVNQAYFAWRPDGGLHLVASSFLDPAEQDKWSSRLQKRVRIYPAPGAPLPSAGYSYHVYRDGYAAWVRRATVGVSEGRNNSWALIGRADVLDFQAAVGLSLRTGWPDDPPVDGRSKPVPADQMRQAAGSADELLAGIRDYQDNVVIVLAALLARPAAALSVIGSVEPERLAIVWALQRIAGLYLPQRFRDRPNWTFSTYEDHHDVGAGDLPGIVFLPVPQVGAGKISRVIVDVAQPHHVDSADLALARQVVRYLIQNRPPDTSIPDSPPARPSPGGSGLPTVPRPPLTVPAPAPEPVPVAERSPVAALLEAQHTDLFIRELNRLEEVAAHEGVALHHLLDLGAVDRLTQFIEVHARNEMLHQLRRLLYGPGLSKDRLDGKAEDHIVKLIGRGQSDQFARMLGAAAPTGRIRDAAFDRWAAGAGKPPGGTVGQLAGQLRGARLSRWFPWVAIGAAALTIALVFLLGYLYGRPEPVTVPFSATTATTPAPQPTVPANQPAGQGQSGAGPGAGEQPSVVIHTDQGGTAWTFQKVSDDQFVLLGLCQPPFGTDWTCTRQPSAGGDQFAIAVPPGVDLTGLEGQQMPRRAGWGKPEKIG